MPFAPAHDPCSSKGGGPWRGRPSLRRRPKGVPKNGITATGEILVDLTQTGVSAGDVPLFAANVAVAASRLGARTAFIGKVGNDGFGAYLRSVLERDHVDCANLRRDALPTTMAVVSLDAAGERSFRFIRGADTRLSPEEVSEPTVPESKILHFGSVSLTPGPSRSATIFAARSAHRAGVLVSYDPNYRAALWNGRSDFIEWMRLPLPLVDLLKLSREELPLLSGVSDPEEGGRILAGQGVKLVLITLGGGVFCRWQEQSWRQPAVPVKAADTNGAGGAFLGAVLSRLSRREADTPLEGLTVSQLKDILDFANRAAAFTCSRSGAIPAMPRLEELYDEKGGPRTP